MVRGMLAALVMITMMTGASYADKTTQANTALCKRFYSEINKGNLGIIDELMAADFVEHEAIPDVSPDKGGVKKFFTMMRTAFPDLAFDVDFYVAEGDMVVAYLTMNGTHKGEFMGKAATGNKIAVKTVDIVRWKGGKIVEHWGVTDVMAMMGQIEAGLEEKAGE